MKKLIVIAMILCLSATASFAEELIKEFKVQNVVITADKNGSDYCRFVTQEERELNGTKYTIGVPVMTFSGSSPEAFDAVSKLSNGDTIKAVVQQRDYKGRSSYTVLAIVQ